MDFEKQAKNLADDVASLTGWGLSARQAAVKLLEDALYGAYIAGIKKGKEMECLKKSK